ncbi:hypothetical protein Tco_0318195 [Tanacetum coccineum]
MVSASSYSLFGIARVSLQSTQITATSVRCILDILESILLFHLRLINIWKCLWTAPGLITPIGPTATGEEGWVGSSYFPGGNRMKFHSFNLSLLLLRLSLISIERSGEGEWKYKVPDILPSVLEGG